MKTGTISKIQRYSTKDGPGLRSTVFTMGCNLKCAWCANPELIAREPKVMYYKERCTKCGRCVEIADNNSIVLTDDGCVIDRDKCTNIIECSQSCYFDAYELIGYEISDQELFDKLMRDETFYKNSKGGVTFSGGEPGLQSEFVSSMAKKLRENHIHVALDTAGLISWEKLEKIVRNIDVVLYDIKAFDHDIHIQSTAVDNDLILENAKRIAGLGVDMYIRMVIVPGLNDCWEDVCDRIRFIKSLGESVKQLDILKYHNLGAGKYKRLGIEYSIADNIVCDDDFVSKVYEKAVEMGLRVSIDG
jgi:pyruvate formate lyase activating enzyme